MVMRNKSLHSTRFLMRRHFYIGIVVLLLFFLLLPMQGLLRLPQTAETLQALMAERDPSVEDYVSSLQTSISFSFFLRPLSLEALCVLYGGSGFLTAMLLFCHLFSRKKSMLVFSLPDTRFADFGRRLLCCLLFCLAPMTVDFLLYLAVVFFNGLGEYLLWGKFLSRAAALLLCALYGVALGALSCVLTGRFWAAALAGGVLSLSFSGMVFLWSYLSSLYLETMPDFRSVFRRLERFSPLYNLYKSVWEPGGYSLWLSVAAIVLAGALALLLYRRRRTEAAERTLAFRPLEWALELPLGLIGGSVVGAVAFVTFGSELSLLLGMLLGTLLTSFLCHLLFQLRLQGMFQRWYLPVGCAVLLLFAVVTLHYDLFGYDRFLPRREQLASIVYRPEHESIFADSYTGESALEGFSISSPEALDAAYRWAEAMRDEADETANGLGYWETGSRYSSTSVLVAYEVGGRQILRRYPNDEARKVSQAALQTILESRDYRDAYASLLNADNNLKYFYAYLQFPFPGNAGEAANIQYRIDLNDREANVERARKLLQALAQDVEERSYADLLESPVLGVSIDSVDADGRWRSQTLDVYPSDRRFLSAAYGEQAEELLALATGGYAAQEDVIAVKQVYGTSADFSSLFDRCQEEAAILETKVASSPEEAAAWAKATYRGERDLLYYAPSFFPQSYSVLYLYDVNTLERYLQRSNLTLDEELLGTLPQSEVGTYYESARYFLNE